MKDQITVTIPIIRYNELLRQEEILKEKSDVIYVSNYWGDDMKLIYYTGEKALKKIQEKVNIELGDYASKWEHQIGINKIEKLKEPKKTWIAELFKLS